MDSTEDDSSSNIDNIDTEPLSYAIIEVGKIYEYHSSDTVMPIEVLDKHSSKILDKEESVSPFLSFKLKNLYTDKTFQVGIESTLIDTLSDECKKYIFKFYPIGTKLKELTK